MSFSLKSLTGLLWSQNPSTIMPFVCYLNILRLWKSHGFLNTFCQLFTVIAALVHQNDYSSVQYKRKKNWLNYWRKLMFWWLCKLCQSYALVFIVTRSQPNWRTMGLLEWCVNSALHNHHQNTKCVNIFWSRVTHTCRIYDKEHRSCSVGLWWNK